MGREFELIENNENYLVVNKPSGFFVHPPEDKSIPIDYKKILLYPLQDQVRSKLYPVHRLDVGTCGVLIFAKNSDASKSLNKLFLTTSVRKKYIAVCRGRPSPAHGEINFELALDSTGQMVPAITKYKTISHIKTENTLNDKFPDLFFSFMEITPETGRFHQIRRHFNRISNPLIGDATHGDTKINRLFKSKFNIHGLCLKAEEIEFIDPWTQKESCYTAPDSQRWIKIKELFDCQT